MKQPYFQKFINHIYRTPKSKLRSINRFGGYLEYNKMVKANKAMKTACYQLPTVKSYNDGLPIYFLTGKDYLYQTLFCITSLVKSTDQKFKFIIVDDGSFDALLIDQIKNKISDVVIISAEEIERNLKRALPPELYPIIREKRLVYPHLKKLTDIHTIQDGEWKLVLDSDMLFWKEPVQLIAWLKDPQNNIFMKDCMRSYGYSDQLMKQLAEFDIPEMLNVGVVGMRSSNIDWNKIESWIKKLEEKEGTSYYLEQALTAMLAANLSATILTQKDYIVYPSDDQINAKAGALHHYVDLSKKGYFINCWKEFV